MRRIALLSILTAITLSAQWGGDLRFCVRAEPKTFHPLLAEDSISETIVYLTGGVLIRVNRLTQEYEPELAVSWTVSHDGRTIAFRLRPGVRFSDGTPFSAEDVAYTMKAVMNPALHSPLGDTFRSGSGDVKTSISGKDEIAIAFPAPVADVARLFDQLPILSSHSPLGEKAVAGPFVLGDYKPGIEVLLKRNPSYWKQAGGRPLPYLDAVHLDIQPNSEIELTRFRRGEIHLINDLHPDLFERLEKAAPGSTHDSGPSPDVEFLWLNQVARSPLPPYKKEWFRCQTFRQAISLAINREDLCRIVYHGHGKPAAGPFSAANKFWFNPNLKPDPYDPKTALRLLAKEGFRLANGTLFDKAGNAVEFSIVTNAGNKVREQMATMIQQDWKAIGIKLNIVALDFPSLIERITRNFKYEACLLGLTNVDTDPSAQMNVWLSSAPDHQWNPGQMTPETPWEAEIDRLMLAQAASTNRQTRKALFDQVQRIVADERPFIYLVNKNALSAVSPMAQNVSPVPLTPQTFWNIERISLRKP